MIVIPVDDLNSQALESVLDEELFYIILDWNQDGQYWEMGIRNSSYITVVDGICVVPNYPLLKQFKYPDMPRGELQVTKTEFTNGAIPRNGFVTGQFQLIYTTHQELLELLDAV